MIDPSNLWLTIHESIGHATELDRALGYEAAYAGTSFATLDKLGTLQVRQPGHERHRRPHRRARPGHDRLRRRGRRRRSSSTSSRDGTLVGYQLNRQMAHANAEQLGTARSNGCAFADSAGHIPLQRMANVSLQPAPDGPSTEELISGVERGIYIVGDRSWSIDMQRFNFQFTGQQFHRIENGRLVGQLRDVAYQATTTDFWGSMEAVGGPDTYVLGGAVQLRQGPAGPGRRRVARLPGRAVPRRQHPQHQDARRGGNERRFRNSSSAALAASTADGCIVIAAEHTETNLRWAGNSLTTNGQMRTRIGDRDLDVDQAERHARRRGHPLGHQRRRARRPRPRVRAGRARRRTGRRRRSAGRRTTRTTTTGPPTGRDRASRCSSSSPPALGAGVRAVAQGRPAAVRLRRAPDDLDLPRHVDRAAPPLRPARRTGRDQRQVRRLRPLGVRQPAHAATSPTSTSQALTDDLDQRLDWAATQIDLPAGRYETILPPTASPT